MEPSFGDLSWASAQQLINRAIVFLHSRSVMQESPEATLEISIAQAIRQLDSEGDDEVRDYDGETSTPTYLDSSDEIGLGELQRIKRIRDTLLGPEGLISKLKKLGSSTGTPQGS